LTPGKPALFAADHLFASKKNKDHPNYFVLYSKSRLKSVFGCEAFACFSVGR